MSVLVERLLMQADDLETYGLGREGLKHVIALEREAAAEIVELQAMLAQLRKEALE